MFTITKENYVAGRNVFWTWWAFFQELDQNIISIGQNIYFIWIYDVIGIKVQIPIPTYYRRKFQGQFYEISPFVISLQLSSLSLSSISYFQYIHILSISLPMIWINMDIMTLEKVLKSHPIVISLRLGNAILPSCILHLGILALPYAYPYVEKVMKSPLCYFCSTWQQPILRLSIPLSLIVLFNVDWKISSFGKPFNIHPKSESPGSPDSANYLNFPQNYSLRTRKLPALLSWIFSQIGKALKKVSQCCEKMP